jgi:hypothetical protein
MRSVVVLNAGWNFTERTVKFQAVYSDWTNARNAIMDIQNNQSNVYNFIELNEIKIDSSELLALEVWKLHNGQFYRDSIYMNSFKDSVQEKVA